MIRKVAKSYGSTIHQYFQVELHSAKNRAIDAYYELDEQGDRNASEDCFTIQ
jgi:hypothetical protein